MGLTSTIAELMLEKGRAQAQGQLGSAYAYGNLMNQFGNLVGSIPNQIEQAKQAQDLQRQRDFKKHLSDAMDPSTVPDIDQNGLALKDVKGIGDYMASKGFGAEFTTAAPHIDAYNQSLSTLQQARMGVLKTGAEGLLASGADPELTGAMLRSLHHNQVFSEDTLNSWEDFLKKNPDKSQMILRQIAGPPKITTGAAGSVARDETGQIVPGSAAPFSPKDTNAVVNGQVVNLGSGAPIGAPVPKQATPLDPAELALKEGQLKEINAKLNGTMPMSEKDRAELKIQRDRLNADIQHWHDTDEAAPVLSDEAKRIAAQQWAMTGQMVPAGMGKAGTKMRADIMNTAADIYKNLDLPSQMAAFKANQASLVRLTGTLDNLSAFEKAAGKNIDSFINLTKNLPDTGVPWANQPLRTLSDKAVGNEYLPAIQAARQIATREVARVVNDPGLRGELTDSARKAVDGMMSGDITIAQLKQVLPVLKQDMANVHSSLSEQMKDISSRIATTPGGSPQTQSDQTKPTENLIPGFKFETVKKP